jgi:Ca2+/Na+ antiporter
MKPLMVIILAGIFILVFGATLMSTAAGIEKITIGLPLTVSGMVIVGIAGLLKSKTIRKFPL